MYMQANVLGLRKPNTSLGVTLSLSEYLYPSMYLRVQNTHTQLECPDQTAVAKVLSSFRQTGNQSDDTLTWLRTWSPIHFHRQCRCRGLV